MPDNKMFWNLRQTLTHNRLWNMIVGPRGGGKTYGAKQYCIDNFIKKGEQFGYIRRYSEDLKKALDKSKFFKDIAPAYPDYEFKSDRNYLYIREKPADPAEPWKEKDIAGYALQLSTAGNLKSISYPNVTTLVFDEFLLENGAQHYLKNEPWLLLNLYETIARPGTGHPRTVLFMLANALTVTNPYFIYFECKWPTRQDKNGKWIWKHPKRPILVEDVKNDLFIETKQKTEFGALVAGTDYGEYSISNKFLLDNDTFIEKKSPAARHYFNFTYLDKVFGVWTDYTAGLMYVSEQIDPDAAINYSITLKDHSPNTMLLKSKNRGQMFRIFAQNFEEGNVRFENMNVKNITYRVIKTAMNI